MGFAPYRTLNDVVQNLLNIYGVAQKKGNAITSTVLGYGAFGSDYASSPVFQWVKVNSSGELFVNTISSITQFPSAVALADAFANPTTTQVGAMSMGFNGTTWDRLRVDASKNLLVSLNTAIPTGANVIGGVTQSGTWNIGTITTLSQFPAASALADALANPTTTNIFALMGGFNGTTWDRLRVDASRNLLTAINVALPTGANVIGGVTQSGTWNIGTITTVTTLSQFASAAALADAFANPTTTNIYALMGGFNGTTWDRLRVDASKNLLVSLNTAIPTGANVIGGVTQSGTWNIGTITTLSQFPSAAALADAFANPTTTQIGSMLMGFGGTTWERLRVDASRNLLVSLNTAIPTGANVIGGVTQSGTWNIGTLTTVTTLSQFASAAALADAFANPTTTNIYALMGGFNGTTWDRLRVDASKNLLIAVNAALPTGTNSIGNIGTVTTVTTLSTLTTLSQFPSTAALADAVANPTLTQIQVFPSGFNGTTWDRLRVESSTQPNLRIGLFQGGNEVNVTTATADALADARNRLEAWVMLSGFNGTTWDRLRVESSTQPNLRIGLFSGGTQADISAQGDALTNATNTLRTQGYSMSFNSSTWDRVRNAVALSNTTAGLGVTLANFHNSATGVPVSVIMGYDPTTDANAYRTLRIRALADALGNPAVADAVIGVGGYSLGFNGTTWDRIRTQGAFSDANSATGLFVTSLIAFNGATYDRLRVESSTQPNLRIGLFQGGNEVNVTTATADALADARNRLEGWVMLSGFNGATWDRLRTNMDVTVLASASRTATTITADQTNYNGVGIIVYLNVTVNPGGAQTLTLEVDAKDSVSGVYFSLTADTAQSYGGGTGTRAIILYPGIAAAATAGTGISYISGFPLPRTWRIQVIHSGAGAWTYSVGASIIN